MKRRNCAGAGRGPWGRSSNLAILLALAAVAHAAADDGRLVDAARRNEPAAVRALLGEGLDVNARHPDGSTALLWSAYYDDADTVDLLLDAGADANAANEYGETPLSLAARNRNPDVAATLLAAGADPHHVKPGGETVLMAAARAGALDVVNLLLARDVDVNAREPSMHQTALMFAAAGRHRAVAEALVAAGADVSAASKGGSTALHFAVQQTDIPTARLLLDAGADVHAAMSVRQMDQFTLGLVETFDGQTPLWLAITNCRKDGLEYFGSTEPHPVGLTCPANEELGSMFLERGADPNQADGARFLPLQRAVQTGMNNLAAALLRHGAEPNAPVAPDVRQWTGENRGGARRIQPVPVGATPYFIAAWTHNPDLMRRCWKPAPIRMPRRPTGRRRCTRLPVCRDALRWAIPATWNRRACLPPRASRSTRAPTSTPRTRRDAPPCTAPPTSSRPSSSSSCTTTAPASTPPTTKARPRSRWPAWATCTTTPGPMRPRSCCASWPVCDGATSRKATMRMLNPPHPGEFVKAEVIEPLNLTVGAAAAVLGVSRPALSTFLNGRSDLSGTMALRIEKAFGIQMDTFMRMQASYDIARTRTRVGDIRIERYRPVAAGRNGAGAGT